MRRKESRPPWASIGISLVMAAVLAVPSFFPHPAGATPARAGTAVPTAHDGCDPDDPDDDCDEEVDDSEDTDDKRTDDKDGPGDEAKKDKEKAKKDKPDGGRRGDRDRDDPADDTADEDEDEGDEEDCGGGPLNSIVCRLRS